MMLGQVGLSIDLVLMLNFLIDKAVSYIKFSKLCLCINMFLSL